MKKFLALLLSLSVLFVMAGCSAEKPIQTATYVMETEDFACSITDTQTVTASGDIVTELDETTVIDLRQTDEATKAALIANYDQIFGTMQDGAPETVTIETSCVDNIYTVSILINVKDSNLQELINGGYLTAGDENTANIKFLSFEKTCNLLASSGYTLQ